MSKKLELRQTTLVDLLVVARSMPEDEVEQILALGGNPEPEAVAMALFRAPLSWTIVDIDTQEPLVVGGYVQTGATVYRSFFLANPRVWEEHGAEVTALTADTINDIKDSFDFVRLETLCLASRDQKVTDWYEKIGLVYDGKLEGYGVKGQDVVLYSTVSKKGDNQIVLASANGELVN